MQDKINGWDITEIQNLFSLINSLGKGKISQAFILHSQKYNRKATSVRNFYYNLQKTNKLSGLQNSPSKDTRRFDKKSEQSLLLNILDYSDKLSVRQKCLQLANYDKTKMLRIQNKYYNLLKNNPKLVKKCVILLKNDQKPIRNILTDTPQNIVTMPKIQSKILSDNDINSLFLGLLNLVKENTMQTLKTTIQKKVEYMTTSLQKSLNELRKKDIIIRELKKENNLISQQLSNAQTKLSTEVQTNTNNLNIISELANSEKMQKLRDFLQKINNFSTISSKKPIDK